MNWLPILVFIAFCASTCAQNSDKKMVCYYGSWAVYRNGLGKFPVENIDPFICTHLIYGFAGLSKWNTIHSLDSWNDFPDSWGKNAFGRFNALKNVNPKLKTILAVGGWNEGSEKYSKMADSRESRKTFVDSVVVFLKTWGFDGLDMDWEYPGTRGGRPEDKQNLVLLLKELKEAFTPYGFLLTSAVGAGKATMDVAYDIPQISKYLDFINVMTYDYHGGWETQTGHNAPLYTRVDDPEENKILNVNYSINYWIDHGTPREKIILGMGLYGRSFTLQNANVHGLEAAAPSKGNPGKYTNEAGTLGYNEICEDITRGVPWKVVWVDGYEAPYAYNGNQWVSYDDLKSIEIKSKYVKEMDLGGAMVWSIETDDFQGICHGITFPLIDKIRTVLLGPSSRVTPRPPTAVTTGRPVHGTQVPDDCPHVGWFRDSDDCTIYWRCFYNGGRIVKREFQCSPGTAFDTKIQSCNWRDKVLGC